MDRIRKAEAEQEPIGIVISTGSRAESEPRFWAYEWWPGPDAEAELSTSGTHRAA